MIPVRCFSCGKVTGNKYEGYKALVAKGVSVKDALDQIGLVRYCCRSVLIGSIDNLEK